MQPNISSDKPVIKKEDDKFQRYNFSSRIAQRIITTQSSDSYVIGIYGAWGEGKTSIINFIEQELKSDNSIISIRFNPWRFTEEATLLVSFFNTLASKLKESFPLEREQKINFIKDNISKYKKKWKDNKEPLKTDKETIGSLLEKYGQIVSIFGAGKAAESIGKSLSNVDVETLKKRFETLLIESKKKLVVFIDDIDRLDKQEIYSIFRLVKLTADFPNTFYILSFDQEMVASAIGNRFGKGDAEAGFNFLEKIIQVPLKIPVAQPDALKKYCFELVEKTVKENQIILGEKDLQRFLSEFEENILIRLKTPRLAVRYGNSLSFTLSLLKDEVNHVDLMLIEALKIFYPSHYDFVKENPYYFLSSYNKLAFPYYNGVGDTDKMKEELIEFFDKLGIGLSKRERECVRALLSNLFPLLDGAFNNIVYHNGYKDWYKEKRIVSPEYFNRYFSYTVLKGELSDISFESFINSIDTSTEVQIIENFKHLIQSSSIDNFLHKLRSREEDFSWSTSQKLALSIALSENVFDGEHNVFNLGYQNPKAQAGIFIYHLLKKHNDIDECMSLAEELMKKAKPFDFAYEINNWLRTGKTSEKQIFSTEQYQLLGKILIDRALLEAGDTPIFEKFPNNTLYLFSVWKEINTKEFDDYIKKYLEANSENVLKLIKAYTPVSSSTNHPEPYKSNFTKDQFRFFTRIFDREYIYQKVNEEFGEEIKKGKVLFLDMENAQTDINILRQFNHWYNEEKTT